VPGFWLFGGEMLEVLWLKGFEGLGESEPSGSFASLRMTESFMGLRGVWLLGCTLFTFLQMFTLRSGFVCI
jgi:hypothetical protein